jgi:hypothetical protein
MLKVFKWLWDKAEKHGEQKVLAGLHSMRQYHHLQSEIAYLEAKHEPKKPRYEDKHDVFMIPRLTPQEHGAVAQKISDFINIYEKSEE